jgi:hypothetical protein
VIGILTAVVALLAIVLAIDLIVTFALIRRVSGLYSGGSAQDILPKVGSAVAEFAVGGEGGEGGEGGDRLELADLRSASLTVIFMMTGCDPCQALLADLRTRPLGDGEPVFAFIAHHGEASDEVVGSYRSQLPPGVRTAVTSPTGDVARAFAVQSFPVALRVDHGVIAASGHSLDAVLGPAGASSRAGSPVPA